MFVAIQNARASANGFPIMQIMNNSDVLTVSIYIRTGDIGSVQVLAVEKLASDRLLIKESSRFFEDIRLHFGDEIAVRSLGDNQYDLIQIIQPSSMCHYFYVMGRKRENKRQGFRPQQRLNDVLVELGGQWECDCGGLFHLHVPRNQREVFSELTGWPLTAESEVFSGSVWDD
jgi:hypothetical protein